VLARVGMGSAGQTDAWRVDGQGSGIEEEEEERHRLMAVTGKRGPA
jgi:hypothetical protein